MYDPLKILWFTNWEFDILNVVIKNNCKFWVRKTRQIAAGDQPPGKENIGWYEQCFLSPHKYSQP